VGDDGAVQETDVAARKAEDAALGVVDDYGDDDFNDDIAVDDDVADEEEILPEDDYGNDFEDGGVGLDAGEVSDDEF